MVIADADVKFARDTVVSVVRTIALKNALELVDPKRCDFWNTIRGTLLDVAIVDWCVLFGSHNKDKQPLHWKNMFEPDAFREDIYKRVSPEVWSDYREKLLAYRNENAAHRDLSPNSVVYPHTEIALTSSYIYFDYLRNDLRRVCPSQAELSLSAQYDIWLSQFKDYGALAAAATKGLRF